MPSSRSSRRSKPHLIPLINKLLQKRLYVVFMTPAKTWDVATEEELTRGLADHWQYLQELESRRALVMAGPFVTERGGWQGSGMMILHTPSRAAAERIARAEPLRKRGLRHNKVCAWQFNAGTLTTSIRVSTR
jgi:uncharacterized protein YciI